MAIDIIHEIKNHLGNAPVPKIDPNTQEPVKEEKGFLNNVESAAIPVALLGFYKNTRNEDDAINVMKQDDASTLKTLFKEHTDQVIKTVSNHSNADEGEAKTALEKTIAAIKKVVRDNVKDLSGFNIMAFFTNQRTNILKHLPTELHAGELLNDPAMDDRTNKMEGPMSGMMHGIEKIFSSNK